MLGKGTIIPSILRKNRGIGRVLAENTINQRILEAEYAVRGPIVSKSLEYQRLLNEKDPTIPFSKIIACNIGNPHALGQKPITFFRQVLALVNVPGLVNHPNVLDIFPKDAVKRAERYIKYIPGGTGAYSHSQGVECLREDVVSFLEARDSSSSNVNNIFLTDGASPGVQAMLQLLIRDKSDGILVPIPQYPLYSASIALNGGSLCGYYLNEKDNWGLSLNELERSMCRALDNNINPRAMVIINPGNPTGQCLDEHNIASIIDFCKTNRLLIMADEVYQENVYAENKRFVSFKKVLSSLGSEYSDVELVSFHSTSKGFLGECGRRGGFMELTNIDEAVKAQIYKLFSVNLCSNLEGQLMVALMTNPPVEGDESYPLYREEKDAILASLRRRAEKLVTAFNQMEGVKCNKTEGALYAFPRIYLPPDAIEAAKLEQVEPDTFYCLELLKQTGVVVVPGSGFGQEEGTYHLRATILPSEEDIDNVIELFSIFHRNFLSKYK